MTTEKRKERAPTGILMCAGRIVVDGKQRYGFFVAANGRDVLAIGNLGLLGKQVVLKAENRTIRKENADAIRNKSR